MRKRTGQKEKYDLEARNRKLQLKENVCLYLNQMKNSWMQEIVTED